MMRKPFFAKQQGIALMEAMVASVVLATGLMALMGLHLHTLAQAQSSAYRLQAIHLIEDLAERLRAQPNAQAVKHLFLTSSWITGDAHSHETSCLHSSCTATQLAQYTRKQWLHNLSASLPQGQAHIFATQDARLLGVMLAWRSNEGVLHAASALLPALPAAQHATVSCPADRSCYVQYIHLTQECGWSDGSACAER